MGTRIEIEGTYVRTTMDRYGVHTKMEAVDLALRHLAGVPMTGEEAFGQAGSQRRRRATEDVGP